MDDELTVPGEGPIARRRRVVRDFLCAMHDIDENVRKFYTFESLLDQFTMKEIRWTLIKLLEDEELEIRLIAATMLLRFKEESHEAVRFFLEQLEGDSPQQSFVTATLLATAEPAPEALLAALRKMLRDKNWFSRVAAAAALVNDDQEARRVLIHALRGGDASAVEDAVADWSGGRKITSQEDLVEFNEAKLDMTQRISAIAANALGRCNIRHSEVLEEAVRVLVEDLKHGPLQARLRNAFLLLNLGANAISALPVLVKLLEERETENELRRVIARIVGTVGGSTAAGKSLVRPLVKALKTSDWTIACNLVASLQAIGEAPRPALVAMVRKLDHPDPEVRRMAADSLGGFGSSALEFLPDLSDRAREEHDFSNWIVFANAVVAIGPPAIPHLVELIVKGDRRDLPLASETLSRMGEEAVKALAQATLTHGDWLAGRRAAVILRAMGPRALPALRVAAELLRNPDEEERMNAIIALSAMGAGAAGAAPDIANALLDPNPEIRTWAEHALVAIGAEAIHAFDLLDAGDDQDARERIKRITGRLGGSVARSAGAPDFAWVLDDAIIECFVLICDVCEREGIQSVRGAAREIERMKSLGEVGDHIRAEYPRIKASLDKLEKRLSKKERRRIRLMGADSTRPGGITDDGRRFLAEFRQYLASDKSGDASKK